MLRWYLTFYPLIDQSLRALLRDVGVRTDRSAALFAAPGAPSDRLRLHRGVLQPAPTPLRSRISLAHQLRTSTLAKSRLTRADFRPLNRGSSSGRLRRFGVRGPALSATPTSLGASHVGFPEQRSKEVGGAASPGEQEQGRIDQTRSASQVVGGSIRTTRLDHHIALDAHQCSAISGQKESTPRQLAATCLPARHRCRVAGDLSGEDQALIVLLDGKERRQRQDQQFPCGRWKVRPINVMIGND